MDKNQQAVTLFGQVAQLYQDKYMDLDLYNDSLDTFCGALPLDSTVLELGCGPGNITRYVLSKRPDLAVLGTDLAPQMLELAKANNPSAQFQLLDCRKINELKEQYHAVIAGFCLPYLSKDETLQLIQDVATVLLPKGLFYISTMEDAYEKSGWQASSDGQHQMYIHYHEAGYLQQALAAAGFDILLLDRLDFEVNGPVEYQDLVLIAQKK